MSLANRMSMASDQVSSVTVEANEFPELSRRYGVQGVPRTVVNRRGAFVGALPERDFVSGCLQLAGVDLSADGEDAGRDDQAAGPAAP